MSLEPVVLFASVSERACSERALVLRAKGIPHELVRGPGSFTLVVPEGARDVAQRELDLWERENRDWPPRAELAPAAPGNGRGTALFALGLTIAYAIESTRAFGIDWIERGGAHAQAIRSGELWRAMTSLLLHTGPPHLLSNLIFGALFVFLGIYAFGGGLGLLLVALSGFLGNVLTAWLQSPDHYAVGASTAVFGAVGLMAGAEWRRRNLLRERRLRRIAPPIIAILIFAYYGLGDPRSPEQTDVVAHVCGLVSGLALGTLASGIERPRILSRAFQRLCYALLGLCLAAAWALALLAPS